MTTDHFERNAFRNQNPAATAGRGLGDVLRFLRTRERAQWPRWVEHGVRARLPRQVRPAACAATFVNHSTFLLQFRRLNVLTDPVYSRRASPVKWAGPQRVHAPGVPFEQLPPVHLVLVSHDHYDHLDLDTLQRLQRVHGPCFVTGLGNGRRLRRHGFNRVVELDWWQTHATDRWRCTFVPAQHWSGRGLRDRNRTLWGGLVLEAGGVSAYFAGDTGYWNHFSAIRERCGEPDLALLPIGAYEPRWFMSDHHMNPDEAVRAHLDLGARQSIAMHFGCFQLTDEAVDEPQRALELARRTHNVPADRFLALAPGETLHLAPVAARRWAAG